MSVGYVSGGPAQRRAGRSLRQRGEIAAIALLVSRGNIPDRGASITASVNDPWRRAIGGELQRSRRCDLCTPWRQNRVGYGIATFFVVC
jgi:hypothetical protein